MTIVIPRSPEAEIVRTMSRNMLQGCANHRSGDQLAAFLAANDPKGIKATQTADTSVAPEQQKPRLRVCVIEALSQSMQERLRADLTRF